MIAAIESACRSYLHYFLDVDVTSSSEAYQKTRTVYDGLKRRQVIEATVEAEFFASGALRQLFFRHVPAQVLTFHIEEGGDD